MARRLILDTNVLIDYERGSIDAAALDDADLAIAALTVAEYRTGIELADSPERAATSPNQAMAARPCPALFRPRSTRRAAPLRIWVSHAPT
ncbi:hypothetical protein [Nostocoides veronense]|uniref:PIN domain-containing protein n=1 Tax=Nostocoides veronense TaxID=330836 RepID=A0ABN2LTX3_9MICO